MLQPMQTRLGSPETVVGATEVSSGVTNSKAQGVAGVGVAPMNEQSTHAQQAMILFGGGSSGRRQAVASGGAECIHGYVLRAGMFFDSVHGLQVVVLQYPFAIFGLGGAYCGHVPLERVLTSAAGSDIRVGYHKH